MMTMTPIKALYRHAEARPQRVAFIKGRDVWTYGRLAGESERLARALVGRGLKPSWWSPTTPASGWEPSRYP
jgi:non-ribosomal peptide synthetase component E (peptide arylation enzyme)